MGWLKDIFKDVFTDPAGIFDDKTWRTLYDPGGFFDEDEDDDDAPPGIDPSPAPMPVSMSRAKAMQDIALRARFGIGASRARSRVVSPFGSGPLDRTYERTRSVSPVSDMSVATSPESEIDLLSFEEWSGGKQYPWYGLRSKDPLTGEEAPASYVMDRNRWLEETGQKPVYDIFGKIGEPRSRIV